MTAMTKQSIHRSISLKMERMPKQMVQAMIRMDKKRDQTFCRDEC